MAINTSARKHRLLIGGQDFSAGLVEVSNWQSTPIDGSGLIRTTATLTLIEVRGLPGSLDDRINSLWRVGQTVHIDVTTEDAGTLSRHPAGTLRILSSEWDYESRRLTLNCGCLITLLSYRQPTDPKKTGIEPGSLTSRNAIVRNLLQAAGITAIALPYSLPYPLHYPEINGSYLEADGKLLYSAGFVGWIDKTETFRIKPVSLQGISQLTLQIGGDRGDELWWRRLSSAEGPREIIKVRGVKQIASFPEYPKQTTVTRYGAANTVIPGAGNYTIVTGYETIREEYDSSAKKLTATRISYRSFSLVYPEKEPRSTNLVNDLLSIESRQFETGDEGKLISSYTKVYKQADVIEAEYIKYKEENENVQFSLGNLILAEEIFTSYTYDRKNRPVSVTTTKYETEVAILTGTNHDWGPYPLPPTNRVPSEVTTETWSNPRLNEWAHTVFGSKSYCRLKPELLTDETTTNQKLSLAADDSVSVREVSNSGQTVPPAPERCPPKANFYDQQVCGEARFSQHGGNPYQERERVFQIDYLAGKVQTQSNVDYTSTPIEDCTDAQCQKIAQIEGALLYGRFKGQDIGLNLNDALFNWEPLMRVNCVEPDGTQRVFALDDAHWYLGQQRAMCNFGCIWIGDASGITRTATVTTSAMVAPRTAEGIASPGDTTISIQPSPGYIPANTVLTIGGVEVVTAEAVQFGDTAIAVVSIPAPIDSGVSATYTEEILHLPYVRVQNLTVRGVGVVEVVARPYALTATTVSVEIVGVGAIAVQTASSGTGAGFYWDDVSEEQWNNMTETDWNNAFPGSGTLTWNAMTEENWNNLTENSWNNLA